LLRSLEELNKIALDGLTEEQWNAFCDVCDLMVRNLSSSKD
jgi:hypothetical protein